YNIVGVLLTGFINGLNPCSFSMLLFLLSILVAKNVNILKIGFTFIVGKFVTYFLLGTLLFNIFVRLDIPHFQIMSKVIMAVILVFIAILNLSDSFAARREDYERIRMQLPIFLRKKNHQWINKFGNTIDQTFLMPLSLMLGVLVSLGEFLCTGQIYLATIISILHDSKTLDYRAIIYFILYGVSFVLPLILATIFVYKGRQIFELTEWLRGKMPVVKLVNAIIFVLFAVFILIWL
ncbi:MAG TPA: glutaredoxin, partial [Clostridia bacterium]|nr:glutaredoxin [Clostridia bacterium]